MLYFAYGPKQTWGKGSSRDEAFKNLAREHGSKPKEYFIKATADHGAYIDPVDGGLVYAIDGGEPKVIEFKRAGKSPVVGENLDLTNSLAGV